jgi:hypothetical protein
MWNTQHYGMKAPEIQTKPAGQPATPAGGSKPDPPSACDPTVARRPGYAVPMGTTS